MMAKLELHEKVLREDVEDCDFALNKIRWHVKHVLKNILSMKMEIMEALDAHNLVHYFVNWNILQIITLTYAIVALIMVMVVRK